MEERPSDSQNESANELPQSVPQPSPTVPVVTDESAVTQRSEDITVSGSATNEQAINEQANSDQVANEQTATHQNGTDRSPINQTESELYVNTPPPNDSEAAEKKQDHQGTNDGSTANPPTPSQDVNQSDTREQITVGQREETTLGDELTAASEPNQLNQERSRQDRVGFDRSRDGQPRQNQSGQPGNQTPKQNQPRADKPGPERSENDRQGQNRQRDPNQPRQQPNQRDPNQPQKQGQLEQERGDGEKSGQLNQPRQQNGQPTGQEKQREGNQSRQQPTQPARTNQPGNERSSQERPGQERPGQERSGQNRQPRDAGSVREVEFEGGDDLRSIDSRQPDRNSAGPREETGRESDNRLTIGITLGDYNGIGPEVILKALQYNRLQKICTPVIYGSMRVLNRYRNLLELKDWNLNGIQQVEQASHKLTNVLTCWSDQNQEIQPGKVTAEAGQAAFACLQRAVEDLRGGKLDAIVTAPINKHNIQSEEFKFPGHTEYLAEAFSVADNLMFMVSEQLRVGVVTGHVPLGRVRQNVTRERILQKLTMMSQSLRLDFGIDKPRIAVLGLNPHAGEEGLLGNEEQEIVKPLIKQLQDKGNLIYGPFPADGFFGTRAYLKFDAVLAMYHDQGLIPFKAIAFEEGVNFTAAMPIVRTSPDHGTAYDIAGKNLADETSMLQAIYTACDIARRRRETAEINAGALKPKRERAVEK